MLGIEPVASWRTIRQADHSVNEVVIEDILEWIDLERSVKNVLLATTYYYYL